MKMAHRQLEIRSSRMAMENDEDIRTKTTSLIQRDEVVLLQNSDHPSMTLVLAPLTRDNFLSWSKSMKIALGAKNKLKFINGSCEVPSVEPTEYSLWKRIDWMVLSWILNSMMKEIAETFVYADSTKALWKDVDNRFGESNPPLIYQIRKEIM